MFNASSFSHEKMAHKRSYLSEELWLKTFLCNFSDIIKISLQRKLQNQHEIIKNRPCLFSFVWWIVFVVVTVEMKQKLSLLCCCDQFLAKFICLFIFSAYNMRETRSRCMLNWFLAKIDGFQWFRMDSSNFRNYQILKLFEQLQQYCKGKKCSKLCILSWAIISWLKNEALNIRNGLFNIKAA